MNPTNTYPRGTVEYVTSTLTDADGGSLTNVSMAIHRGDPVTWIPCTWANGVARTTNPVAFTKTAYPDQSYTVSCKASDNPETPIVRVGRIIID